MLEHQLEFIPIKAFIKDYRRRANEAEDDPDYSSPLLFVWESFRFCDCDNYGCGFIDENEIENIIDTLKEVVHTIAVRRRSLKQRNYNDKACYYVNDYYFTLKEDPLVIYGLYTNILLSKWCYGKWHRRTKAIRSRLVNIGQGPVSDEYIIPDVWADFYLPGINTCDEYYDRSTLDFPSFIANHEESNNSIARDVADALSFAWPVQLSNR